MSRTVNVSQVSFVTVDGVPIAVMTLEEYQMCRVQSVFLVVIAEKSLRLRRENGNAMLSTPSAVQMTKEMVVRALAEWFLKFDGPVTERFEDALRTVASEAKGDGQ